MIKKDINDLFNNKQISAIRKFTDRTDFIEAFWSNMNNREDLRILNYYGIGGIGKTALRKEIIKQISENNEGILSAYIDFEENEHKQCSYALFHLRSELKSKYKIKFPYFEFAYARYMRLRSPQYTVNEDTFPLLEEGDFLAGLISELGDIPYIGLPAKLGMILEKGYKVFRNHNIKYNLEQLHSISNLDSVQLSKRLPHYFAYDITNYLDSTEDRIVLLLDSFEALYEQNNTDRAYQEGDRWLREELIPYLPKVMWVIFGREKLKWEEMDPEWSNYIEGHLIKKLSDNDIRDFLSGCQIYNEDIQNRIIQISEGHPYSIDLLVDMYYSIMKSRLPDVTDFGVDSNQRNLFSRFMKHINPSEKEVLKVLSLTRHWNREVFCELTKEFNINYPITRFNELNQYSFIEEKYKDVFRMYSLMSKNLQAEVDQEVQREINKCMYNYYNKKLQESPKTNIAVEAFFHGSKFLDINCLCQWLNSHKKIFKREGNIKELAEAYEEIFKRTSLLKLSEISCELIYDLIEVYFQMGQYMLSQNLLLELKEFSNEEQLEKIHLLLARNYKATYNYKDALASYKYYFDRYYEEKAEAMNICYYEALIDYGKLLVFLSKYEDAICSYNRALELLKQQSEQHDNINLFINLAIVYEKLGEVYGILGEDEKSKENFDEGLNVYDNIFNSDFKDMMDHDKWIHLLNNYGFLYKRLAEYFVEKEDYEKAKDHYTKAINQYDLSINNSPYYIDTFKKKGFALRGLMRILAGELKKNEIYEYLELVEAAFDKALLLNSKDVSAIHSKGGANIIYSNVLTREGDFEQALTGYNKAVALAKKAIEIQPDYLYAYDGLAEALICIAELNESIGEKGRALSCYEESLKVVLMLLDCSPNAPYALAKKDKISKKLANN